MPFLSLKIYIEITLYYLAPPIVIEALVVVANVNV